MGEVFPLNVPGRTGHGALRNYLASRDTSRLQVITHGFTLDDLAGAGRERVIDEIVAGQQITPFEWAEPEIDKDRRSKRTFSCDDPMCPEARRRPGTERRHNHTDTMLHLNVAVTAGDASLLKYWPSGSHRALDQDFVSCTARTITLRFHTGDRGAAMARQMAADLTGLLEAANGDIAEYNAGLRERVSALVERRLATLRREEETIAATGFPSRSRREAPVEYRIPDRKRDALSPVPPAQPAEVGYQLSREDFEAVLQCIWSWADSAERSPGVAAGVGEEELRNSLLATLRARFIDGAGEAFSVSGKTDLRILVRTALGERGPQVFHAECKIWEGPASVDRALFQLVELYSTHRDRLGALVFFIVDRANPQKVTPTAVAHLCDAHGATEVGAIGGWRVVRIPDPKDPEGSIELAVVVVDVQRHR